MPATTTRNTEQDMLLRVLNQEGMFYVLEIKTWSARSQIKPAELNLPKKVDKKLFALGSKKLLLKEHTEEIDAIRVDSYEILKYSAYSQPFFGMRFIRGEHVNTIEGELMEAKAKFFRAVDKFMSLYPAHVDEMRELWTNELAELYPNSPDLQRSVLQSVLSAYPDSAEVRQKFSFDWINFAFALPDTNIAAGISDVRQVQETTKTVERMQAKMQEQLEAMVRRDATNLEQAIRDLCEKVLETSEASPSGLHQRTVDSIRKEIETLRAINYADVKSVNTALKQLEAITQEKAADIRKRDGVESFRAAVSNIKNQIEQALDENKEETLRGFIKTGRRKIETPF